MIAETVNFDNTKTGAITYVKACRWLSESFHNAWLRNLPSKDEHMELWGKQNFEEKYHTLEELTLDWHTRKDEIAWSGLLRRTTDKAIHMKRGLRSGERNTDMTNTLLNRI